MAVGRLRFSPPFCFQVDRFKAGANKGDIDLCGEPTLWAHRGCAGDTVAAHALGMNKLVSEDSVHRALQTMSEPVSEPGSTS